MFATLEFYAGLLVASVFATLILMVGGVDTAVAAVGIPALVGFIGTAWLGALRVRTRKQQEAST